ncbi:MAG TPA: hypothetical protein VGO57_14815 [Verrucomicrobiae bacterium]|jgi:hypothetical protein
MPNYFEENTEGINRGLNNLATAFARQPYYQTLAQNRTAQAGYDNQRASEQSSLAELNRARTADLLRKGALVDALQRVSPAAQSAMLSGNFDDPSVQQFTGAVSALTGQNQGDVQKSMKQGLGTILAMRGNLPMAAAVENPVSVQNNQVNAAAEANRPANNQVILPTGGTLVDRSTGRPISEGGVTLRQGESRFAPKTLATTSALPAASSYGASGNAPITESPEGVVAPAQGIAKNQLIAALLKSTAAPASTMGTTNVPAGGPAQGQSGGQTSAPANVTTAQATVRVQHPNGQTGVIPAANLLAALKAGYKQLQ